VTNPTLAELARSLSEAQSSRTPTEPLIRLSPGLSIDDAYQVQLLNIAEQASQRNSVRGHKIGLTAAAMRRQLNVDQPDYGHLTDDMFFPGATTISIDRFISPRIEPEIAFVLKSRLEGPGITVAQALAAVDYVVPALEIIDSRIRDWEITLVDTIADNASSGGVILGRQHTALASFDLRLVGCNLTKNGEIVATGAGGAVLGSPINALVWLANALGERGVVLEAGQVILSGAVTGSVPIQSGDMVLATFASLGTVSTRFHSEQS